MTTKPRRGDGGFTLIEVLIAMMVMTIAVITLVGALASMMTAAQNQRGLAVAEATVKNYAQALQARSSFVTTSTAAMTSASLTLRVADASLFPGNYPYFVVIGSETMKVTGASSNELTVERAQGDPSSASAHPANSSVARVLRCATASEYELATAEYAHPAGVTVVLDTTVEYWLSGAFRDRNACIASYDATCRYPTSSGTSPDIRHACGSGLARLTLRVDTTGDSRLQGVETTTTVLIRRGSAV